MSSPSHEILKIEGLSKSFGDLKAVDNVNLSVKKNEIRAIIGPNGAGKTTFFNLITGELKSDSGKVIWIGKEITGYPPHRIIGMGVTRSFQITNIFLNLTVFENVMLPIMVKQKKQTNFFHSARRIKKIKDETLYKLSLVGLEDITNMKGSTLSHGDKKRLEIAMVLAGDPELLLLDEPTAGMSQEETTSTVNLVQKVAEDHGITVIFTEHDMDVVYSISDNITVLQQGQVIAEGTPDEIRVNKQVIEAYIGESV